MSRVTPPVTKLSHAVRSITSASRQSGRHASSLPLKSAEPTTNVTRKTSKHESDHDSRLYHTLPPHRPTTSTPTITIPLMQGFRTSTSAPSPIPASRTMDFITLPVPLTGPSEDASSRIRVPLLPDNYSPDRSASSAHVGETLDAGLAGPVVHVVAANPETVAVLSEVVIAEEAGGAWTAFALRDGGAEGAEEREPGLLGELWSGIVEDIFGEGQRKSKLAV